MLSDGPFTNLRGIEINEKMQQACPLIEKKKQDYKGPTPKRRPINQGHAPRWRPSPKKSYVIMWSTTPDASLKTNGKIICAILYRFM